MTRVERWLLSLLSLVVAASGLVYLWMKYVLQPADPFAVVNHPWQPYVLDAHVLAAPALLIVFGMVWTSHMRGKIAEGQHDSRRTGLVSLWAFVTMSASGYVLQVLTSDLAHRAAVIVHAASGMVFVLAYAGHFIASVRRQRQRHRLRSAA